MVLFPAKDRESRRFRPTRRKGRRIGGKAGGSAERPADRRKGRRIGGKAGGQSSQGELPSGRCQNPFFAVEGRWRGRSQDAGEGGTVALRLSCFPRGGIGPRPLIAGEARLLAVGIDDGRPSSRWSASGTSHGSQASRARRASEGTKRPRPRGGAPSVERDVGFGRRWGVVGLRRKRGLSACARSRSRHVAETDGRAPGCGHRSRSTRSEPLWYHSGNRQGATRKRGRDGTDRIWQHAGPGCACPFRHARAGPSASS